MFLETTRRILFRYYTINYSNQCKSLHINWYCVYLLFLSVYGVRHSLVVSGWFVLLIIVLWDWSDLESTHWSTQFVISTTVYNCHQVNFNAVVFNIHLLINIYNIPIPVETFMSLATSLKIWSIHPTAGYMYRKIFKISHAHIVQFLIILQ